jgi:hypothetical protein
MRPKNRPVGNTEDKEHQKSAPAACITLNDLTMKTFSTTHFKSEGVECVTVQPLVPSAKRKQFSPKDCAVMSFSRQTAYPGLARTSALNTSYIKKHVLVAHAFN